jgi:hypothetical protein
MMANEKYRTTISLYLWTMTPEAAEGTITAIENMAMTEGVLASVEYFAEGRPEEPVVPGPQAAGNGKG